MLFFQCFACLCTKFRVEQNDEGLSVASEQSVCFSGVWELTH